MGCLQRSAQLLQQSLALLAQAEAARVDTRVERAQALYQLADREIPSGDQETAAHLLEESLGLYQEVGEQWWSARVLTLMGRSAMDFERGRQLLEESLAIARTLEDGSEATIGALFSLAELSISQGMFRDAEDYARECRAVALELDQPGFVFAGFRSLGEALISCGHYSEAESIWEQHLAMAPDFGLSNHALSLIWRGVTSAHQGQYKEACACGELALNIAREREVGWANANSLLVLSIVPLAVNENHEARKLLDEGLSLARKQRLPIWFEEILLGIAALTQGRTAQARRHLCQVLRQAAEAQDFWRLLYGLSAIARFHAYHGETHRAVELYALALRYPHVANSRWFEDVAGKPIAAVAATLPPDVVAAAQERGRARDLWATAQELLEELEEVRYANLWAT